MIKSNKKVISNHGFYKHIWQIVFQSLWVGKLFLNTEEGGEERSDALNNRKEIEIHFFAGEISKSQPCTTQMLVFLEGGRQ